MTPPTQYSSRRWRINNLLIAAITIAVASGPSIASAEVVYLVLRDQVWGVYFQGELKTAPRAVVRSGPFGDVSAPTLSPDRRMVALEEGGEIAVCPIHRDGECRRVRSSRGWLARPAWHPVTRELVLAEFAGDEKEEGADILTTRNGLNELSPLLAQTGVQDDPTFSRDGRLLAYTVAQTVSMHKAGVQVVQQLWLADMVSGVARQLLLGSSRDMNPAWAPSGSVIAFASNRSGDFEIWAVYVDGTGLRRLTSGPGAKTRPRWSPDGKSIMFTMAREGRLGLWIIDADGSNLRQFEPFGPNSDVQLRDADWR